MGLLYVLKELHDPKVDASSVDLSSFHLNPKSCVFCLRNSHLGHICSSLVKYSVSIYVLGNLDKNISACSG